MEDGMRTSIDIYDPGSTMLPYLGCACHSLYSTDGIEVNQLSTLSCLPDRLQRAGRTECIDMQFGAMFGDTARYMLLLASFGPTSLRLECWTFDVWSGRSAFAGFEGFCVISCGRLNDIHLALCLFFLPDEVEVLAAVKCRCNDSSQAAHLEQENKVERVHFSSPDFVPLLVA